jgi:hypothetical protein
MAAPLHPYEKDFIIHMGTLGSTRKEIVADFKKRYGRPLHTRTITLLWRENRERMDEARRALITPQMQNLTGDLLKRKSYGLIKRRLDRAEADESEIERIRLRFKAGQISKHEFDEQVARYEQLTITELVKLADMGAEHARKNNDGPTLTPEDQAALSLLTEGLKNGNPLQLIQVINPKMFPNGENPAPPAGTR